LTLPFELYLTRAFEEGFRVAQKPIDVDTVNDILAPDLDGLEARLTRNGYNTKVLTEMLGAKPRRSGPFWAGICHPSGHRSCTTSCWPPACRYSVITECGSWPM
jgi:hypothetical protein